MPFRSAQKVDYFITRTQCYCLNVKKKKKKKKGHFGLVSVYPAINLNGKEYNKVYIYIYIYICVCVCVCVYV